MKRYLLFCYYRYEPSGGWEDLFDSFDTFEEAAAKALQIMVIPHGNYYDRYQVVDTQTGKIILDCYDERD